MARYVTRRTKAEDEFWSDDIPRPSTIETIWRVNDPIGFRIND